MLYSFTLFKLKTMFVTISGVYWCIYFLLYRNYGGLLSREIKNFIEFIIVVYLLVGYVLNCAETSRINITLFHTWIKLNDILGVPTSYYLEFRNYMELQHFTSVMRQ